MAIPSYRLLLYNLIRDVLYNPRSNGSAAPLSLIPSLDLIKIIWRLAEPPHQFVVWQSRMLHSLQVEPTATATVTAKAPVTTVVGSDSEVRVSNCQLLAERAPDLKAKNGLMMISPISVEFRCVGGGGGSGSGTGGGGSGGSGGGGGVMIGRYIVSIIPKQFEIRILQSTAEDMTLNPPPPSKIQPSYSSIEYAKPDPDRSYGEIGSISLDRADATRFLGFVYCTCIGITAPHTEAAAQHHDTQPQQQLLVGSIFVLQYRYEPNNKLHGRSDFETTPLRFDMVLPAPESEAVGTAKWTALPLPPFDRNQPALAFDPATQMVYMCGGANETGIEKAYAPPENARYSVSENKWWTLPAAHLNRRHGSAVVYRSHLVVAGGTWQYAPVYDVEALPLNPESGDRLTHKTDWSFWVAIPVPPNQSSLRHPSLVVLDDRLYFSWNELTDDRSLPSKSFRVLCLKWDVTKNKTPTGWCRVDQLPATLAAGSPSEKYLLVV